MFDDIVERVAEFTCSPICLITLVDRHRQWFKAKKGLDITQTPIAASFCAHTIKSNRAFEVRNALLDRRFAENPFVLGSAHIRYYAGLPLRTPSGDRIGALCVLDHRPRSPLSQNHVRFMRNMSRMIVKAFEQRRDTAVKQQAAA
ncbi:MULTISPECIES: GAF domain-containing protein [unclassified Sphingomonas]|uniref:GAF domain-containing protein n=1 Tax=unclassified Sphingomonas TaxID=196159 RepID=UPI002269BBE6|nr:MULTISPECIES: GAF domain-containing protein [unclassified Sphingomonas]